MKIASHLSCILIICIVITGCFKDPPKDHYFYPWECNFNVNRNGKNIVITDAKFEFSNRINPVFQSEGDSILTIILKNDENTPHSESIILYLIPDSSDEFIKVYDVNKLSEHSPALKLSFYEWHTPLADFELDKNYSNTVEILSISPDKKTLIGKMNFRVLLSENDKLAPGQWAPDTITYSNGNFNIKSLE